MLTGICFLKNCSSLSASALQLTRRLHLLVCAVQY